MKSSTFINLLCLLPMTAFASFGLYDVPHQHSLSPDQTVPGTTPAKYCNPNFRDDMMSIDYIKMNPKDLKAGQNLTISAKGSLKSAIEKGAYIKVEVKYGFIRLLSRTLDFCDEVKEIDLDCPVKKGPRTISRNVTLPDLIPNGRYVVVADAFTEKGERIVCLTASVVFGG